MTTFGKFMRDLRVSRGWSQDELSKRAGLAKYTIIRIERMERPGVQQLTLASLAGAYGLSADELMARYRGGPPAGSPQDDGHHVVIANYEAALTALGRRRPWFLEKLGGKMAVPAKLPADAFALVVLDEGCSREPGTVCVFTKAVVRDGDEALAEIDGGRSMIRYAWRAEGGMLVLTTGRPKDRPEIIHESRVKLSRMELAVAGPR